MLTKFLIISILLGSTVTSPIRKVELASAGTVIIKSVSQQIKELCEKLRKDYPVPIRVKRKK